MTAILFSVKSWAAWTPGETDGDCWRGPGISESSPPMLLRRRISRLGQRALKTAWDQPGKERARLIFSSRHGEFGRTLSIMDSLTQGTEVSPADFTLSVHHALAGLLSIATGNTEGHTAVSSGMESLFYALLEGAVCRSEKSETPVLVAHYDELLPEPYNAFGHDDDETVALTLCLDQNGEEFLMSWAPSAEGASPSRTPGGQLLDLLDSSARSAVIVGERLTWTIERTHAAA